MSIDAPEMDVATQLAAGLPAKTGGASWAVGTNIKCGPPRDSSIPGAEGVQVWCMALNGASPAPFLGGSDAGSMLTSNVQVFVQSANGDDYFAGLTVARAARDVLHTHEPTADYSGAWVMESEPLYLGPQESGQHGFTVNVRLLWKRTF